MKKDIKLKTQFFLKKTYTYRSFRFFKKLNVSFFKNAFYFFHFFKFFSFFNLFKSIINTNIKILGSNTVLLKKFNLIFFKKKNHKSIFDSLHNTNYVVFDPSITSKGVLTYKHIFYGYALLKKKFIIFNVKRNNQHDLILNNHLLLLTIKSTITK